jgi:hypothetical protein
MMIWYDYFKTEYILHFIDVLKYISFTVEYCWGSAIWLSSCDKFKVLMGGEPEGKECGHIIILK